MTSFKVPGLVGIAVLALTAFVGVSSASAQRWLDNGSAIASAENVSFSDDGNGLTFSHTGGLAGTRSKRCNVTGTGTAGPGAADSINTLTFTNCVNLTNCLNPSVSAVNLPWLTTLVSTTEDDITAHSGGANPGWTFTCNGISITCTKATTPTGVSNQATTPATVKVTFNPSTDVESCNDGGTATVSGMLIISLNNGDSLSVGP